MHGTSFLPTSDNSCLKLLSCLKVATFGEGMAKHGLSEKRLVTLGKQLIRNRIIQTQAVFASRPKKEWTGEEEQRLRKLAKRRRTASGMSDDDTQLVSLAVLHCEQTSSTEHKMLASLGLCMLNCAVLCCAVLCCAVLCCAVLCCAVLCCAVLCCAVLCCAVRRCAINSSGSIHCVAQDLEQKSCHHVHVHAYLTAASSAI